MPVLPSYRNQSNDLLCKSIDWFLHEGNPAFNGIVSLDWGVIALQILELRFKVSLEVNG